MFCPHCGKELPDDSVFCEHCGNRIDEDQGSGMADEPVAQESPKKATQKASSDGNKMQPVIIAVLVLVIVALLGAGYYFTKVKKAKNADSDPDQVSLDEALAMAEEAAAGEPTGEVKEEAKEESAQTQKEENATDKAEQAKADSAEKETGTSTENAEKVEDVLTGGTDSAATTAQTTTEQTTSVQTTTDTTTIGATTSTDTTSDTGINPDYNPATYAISGGTWDVEQSGERTYTLANGNPVSNCWVDEKGKYYYVDFSGCLMKNNYTADGFYVKDDGSWDKSVKQRQDDVEPISGQSYGTDPVIVIDIINYSDGANYAKAVRTYSFGYSESFNVMPLGNSTYLLEGKDDFNSGFLMSVSEDQKTLKVSGLGTTEEYAAQ
jgi:hypothetical protein